MTTLTDGTKVCSRDSGLLIRDCPCSECESCRDDFRELHAKLADTYLANRHERDEVMAAILREIERYKRLWL